MYGIISPYAQNVGGHTVNNTSREVHRAHNLRPAWDLIFMK